MPKEIGINVRYIPRPYASFFTPKPAYSLKKHPHRRTDQDNNWKPVSRCYDGNYEDVLTPEQYYGKMNTASSWTQTFRKYHALWTACLFDAYKTLKEGTLNERRLETFWFKSKANRIGSFLWICQQLGLDSTAIREEVLK